ncbi:hypothetical protein K432DRAFT_331057 [Lepidopterella palustris CBS 459.81]|uniref:Rhodopsin domain-containing protein n=1 Tax=Lepidopterella palustris CBS 459.81 TaxID=1314670 RepID=A0A8E2JEE5_9PEZI|nr:hypothetical protein K432DRAFT_331057 [Lepidopterella palustris CBS 459.81]
MVAATTPPGPDVSIAPRYLGLTGSFLGVGIFVYILRMYTRIWPVQRLGLDDWSMTVSVILMTSIWAMCAQAIKHGMGRHNYYVPLEDQMKAGRLLFIIQPMWVWSIAFVKISMAFMLLRILRSKNWHMFLYATIAVQVVSSMIFMFILLLQCRPIYAIWDPATPNAKCWSPLPAQIGLYGNAAISIITDFVFTVLPITFIHKMNLPLRQRVAIGSLMCLGLFATAAGIVKTSLVKTYNNGGDNLYHMVDLITWGFLEEEMGIIAVCIPCLKALIEGTLKQLRIISSENSNSRTAHNRSGYLHFGGSQTQAHQLESMRSRSRNHWRKSSGDQEAQSQEVILPVGKDGEIVKTTEFTFVTEEANKDSAE